MLTLALVLGLMPGMGLTAYAEDTEPPLTTITAIAKEQANYSTANVATVSFSYTAGGSSAYLANWGWWGYGWSATVNAAKGYTITKCVFYDDADRTATDSSSPFVVETTEADKTPQVNGTPIDGGKMQSKGIKKIEVYGYATPAATYSVNVTAGDNMTKTTDSGAESQTVSVAITDVVYTADSGYYFPTDYSVASVNGIGVTRNSYTQITVSGTPTADTEITLIAPTEKTTPSAPTLAAAVNCTTADNNDGKLTGVTTAMEYQKSGAAEWTAGTGSDITGLVPGTYYVRYKETDTTNVSGNQELTIAGYTAPSFTVTYKVVHGTWSDNSTTDKTETVQSGSKPASVPTGMKAAEGYTGGSWDKNPADTTITEATTFTYTFTEKQKVATPTFSPEAGTYTGEQSVIISCTTDGAEIYYTTDGSDPSSSSTKYSSAIAVGETTTIKAIAVKDGMTDSSV
ncbi:chitobiase/beta-hexosaminidase C-terminal domain-containing protein, partial [Butyrivibrio proteoclasticus]|uniref:chitobiase/beta-hexosaminidase C-terminal domain-containing protein n=1 Tax=Butyrivibrio proteoclasticus TaxID=43305 RepID=UPI001FA8817D